VRPLGDGFSFCWCPLRTHLRCDCDVRLQVSSCNTRDDGHPSVVRSDMTRWTSHIQLMKSVSCYRRGCRRPVRFPNRYEIGASMQVSDADTHSSLVAWSGCVCHRFAMHGDIPVSQAEGRWFSNETSRPAMHFFLIRFSSETYCGPGQRYSGLPDQACTAQSRVVVSVT